MLLDKLFSKGRKEQVVIERITEHIRLLEVACEEMRIGMEGGDLRRIHHVLRLEREADAIRRQIIAAVYEGAFLPYLRPNLCRFAENVDRVFDAIEETAYCYLEMKLPSSIRDHCLRIAFYNVRISEMLLISFLAMLRGDRLREKTLAVRIYEKKIDDLKLEIRRKLRSLPVEGFWEGKALSDFVTGLTSISDIVEDASDDLHIMHVSMR
ncbi:MAG: TIGR00153 family protein [Desulfobacteraceae bacterium]|jgi:predicted phosphate transport protein (TIGR00153 family)|nr:TIGR00153 family protein [Desulfobacteraceae bacterium]